MKKEKSMMLKDSKLIELKEIRTFTKCEVGYSINYQESSIKYELFSHTYMNLMRS